MTRLSINVNKVALLRNARGGNLPNLLSVALDCEHWGADGITVHPRPDERHIRYNDIPILRENCETEFNIEGNPTERFMELVLANPPHQCTLVPDAPDNLTSDSGWDTKTHLQFLQEIIGKLHEKHIRVSIFLDPIPELVYSAKETGADRIELYTGPFAFDFQENPESAIEMYTTTAAAAHEVGLGINAGHDLNLDNLKYFKTHIPNLLEVSIGHALVCDALYYGLQNVIGMYKHQLA